MSGIIIPGSGIIIPDMQQEAIRSDSKRFEARMAASVSKFGSLGQPWQETVWCVSKSKQQEAIRSDSMRVEARMAASVSNSDLSIQAN